MNRLSSFPKLLNQWIKTRFLYQWLQRHAYFFGTPHVKTSKASWTQMRWQISRVVVAQDLSSQQLPTRMLMSAEAEDMLKLSADFCLHSGQTKLVSIYETLVTSTNRGKTWVSRSNCDGVLILTEFSRWYRKRMLLWVYQTKHVWRLMQIMCT